MPSSSYKVVVDPVAAKEITRLHKGNRSLAHKIASTIDELALDPLMGKPLKGDKKGCYSLRCADWRVIYETHHSSGIVHIIRIGHRKDIYR